MSMIRVLTFVIFTTAMLLLPALAKHITDGFKISSTKIDFPFHAEWEMPFDSSISAILNQPFHYIGKGSQCYVFESRDQKHVIKFFRFRDRASKLNAIAPFNAAHIAYTQLKEETGIVFVHLNHTAGLFPTICCKDPVGRSHSFKLDQCRFVIQKKAIPFRVALQEAINDPILMQKRIDQFLDLLNARTSKGIFNADPSLFRNFGFLETRAVEIDFGNFKPLLPHSPEQEKRRYINKFRHWLQQEAPEWVAYLDQSA